MYEFQSCHAAKVRFSFIVRLGFDNLSHDVVAARLPQHIIFFDDDVSHRDGNCEN